MHVCVCVCASSHSFGMRVTRCDATACVCVWPSISCWSQGKSHRSLTLPSLFIVRKKGLTRQITKEFDRTIHVGMLSAIRIDNIFRERSVLLHYRRSCVFLSKNSLPGVCYAQAHIKSILRAPKILLDNHNLT